MIKKKTITKTKGQSEEYLAFVYGTLKKDFSGHHLIEDATFIGKATTVDKYLLTSNTYPLLSKSKQLCHVKGECYSIDASILKRLDRYERVPDYYTRDLIQVKMEKSEEIKDAFAYFCEHEVGETVHEDGHYVIGQGVVITK